MLQWLETGLIDVVYGNLNGMYTILVDPITEKNDNFPAKMIRRIEHKFLLPILFATVDCIMHKFVLFELLT